MGVAKTNTDVNRAYSIIKECGSDSQQYLSLGEKNQFFFGSKFCGVIAYQVVRKKAMSIGDPACRPENLEQFTLEYIHFCENLNYKPIFNSVSGAMTEILQKHNYVAVKYGEEAILELSDYTLAGGTRAALRRNVNKVGKSGVSLMEYRPSENRDYELENKISILTEKWFQSKGYQLRYSVGSLDFDRPFDRRYFITKDENGDLLTVISFLPYEGGKNYCIDVMYRKLDSMTGVMEHAIFSAAMKMKEDGVEKVSLGIAPLAGLDITSQDVSRAEKIMSAMYNSTDFDYNFKNLYRFKKKFAPQIWETRYLVYHKSTSLVSLALSITDTKRGPANIAKLEKCKFFFIKNLQG